MDSNPIIRIIKIIQDDLWVDYQDQQLKVSIKGALRQNKELKPVVGDHIDLQFIHNHPMITKIHKRYNLLVRPKVANVDLVVIVQSTIEPQFNTLLMDQMITSYSQLNCDIVIALTKTDLDYTPALQTIIHDYRLMGIESIDIQKENGLSCLLKQCKNKTVCFVGNSGVGKSTLINAIDPQLLLKTQAISKALNRGKHTTTNTVLIPCQDFYLIDTPGYSTVSLDFDPLILAHNFFKAIIGDSYCQFNDCFHRSNSSNCLVLNALKSGKIIKWRYDNYLRILSDLGAKYDKNRFK